MQNMMLHNNNDIVNNKIPIKNGANKITNTIVNANSSVNASDKRLDVNNYSISELSKMIGIKDDFSENAINTKCNHLINTLGKSKSKSSNIQSYTEFIKNVQKHLINYIQHKSLGYNSTLENIYINDDSKNMQLALNNNVTNAPIRAYSTLYPNSVINPVYKETVTQLVSIDSIFRDRTEMTNDINYYESSSHFQYKFANPVKNVVSMKITSIEIPVVWYLFNESNNTFTIETKNNPDGVTPDTLHTIIVPVGSYTNAMLVTIMNNMFTNIGNGLEYIIFGIDETTGKSYFRAKKNGYDDSTNGMFDPYLSEPNPVNPFMFNIYFYKDFTKTCEKKTLKEYDSIGWLLGFRSVMYSVQKHNIMYDYYSRATAYELYNYVISEGAYGTSAYNYIYVDVDDFNNNFKSSGIIADNKDMILSNTILGRISIPNPANTVLFGNSSDKVFKTREYFGPITITRLDLKLLDKFGNLLNLQNNDWSIALEFTVLYQ
jgi:hypothetical protein